MLFRSPDIAGVSGVKTEGVDRHLKGQRHHNLAIAASTPPRWSFGVAGTEGTLYSEGKQLCLQPRDGQVGYIAKSDVRDTIQVLWNRDGQIQGRTFNRAQCMFAARAVRQKDGRVEVELVPELQYGEARQQYEGEQGVFRVQFARPKQVFAELAIHAVLSPGQMLVIGGRETRPGSIGQQFFSTISDHGEEQKLLVVRLVHAAPADPLQADTD